MSESQSRYSIVERLTHQKLDIMGAKSKLAEDVKDREQVAERLKKNIENWKKDIPENIKREERGFKIELEKAQEEADYAKTRQKEKEKVYDEKIKAIEDALDKIEEISKTSQS